MNDRTLKKARMVRAIYYSRDKVINGIRAIILKLGGECSCYYTPIRKSETLLFKHELLKVDRFFDRCKKHLEMPGLWIEWIQADTEKSHRILGGIKQDYPIAGHADVGNSEKISIRGDIPFDEILRTIAHEAHHHWFYKKYGKTGYWNDEEMRESAAEGFAGKMLAEYKIEEIDQKRRLEEAAPPSFDPRDWN